MPQIIDKDDPSIETLLRNMKRNHENILSESYVVMAPDGSEWGIPVLLIAINMANAINKTDIMSNHNALESVVEDFKDHSCIEDWAKNNMTWTDVLSATRLISTSKPDEEEMNDAWIDGPVRILKETTHETLRREN